MSDTQEQVIGMRNWDLTRQRRSVADSTLVAEFIAGSDASFTQLVTRYKDPIINYVNTMVGNYDTAADLAQETFLRVYQNIGRYNSLYQFSTWIYRIATNLAIDEMRYRKRRGQVFFRNIWGNQANAVDEEKELALRDSSPSPGDEVLRKEGGQVLGEAIRSLPPKYRTTFVMKEIQGLSHDEIARVLSTSPGTIKSRLHRAKELLQRKLEHYR